MNPEGRAGAISRFFIERPVLANVLALVFVLVGLVSLYQHRVATAHGEA